MTTAFGHPLRPAWGLQEGMTFLNHGSFGATPLAVLQAQARWRERLEAQPIRFMVEELGPALRHAAGRLAAYVGAEPDGLVFTDNASTAVCAVLASVSLRPGDRVVCLSHVYPAVLNALELLCARSGARLVVARLPCPVRDPVEVVEALERVTRASTALVVVDHVTSATGLVLPVQELVDLCRRREIPVLVDGAHAVGMLPLALEDLGADWYTSNNHKWLCAPKGSALLHSRAEVRGFTRPLVVSHGWFEGYLPAWDFVGTRDPSAWLAVTAALDFREALGEQRVLDWNRGLTLWGRALLADALGAEPAGPPEMIGSLASLRLPPRFGPGTLEGALALRDDVWRKHRVEVMVACFDDALWVRISGQVYVERSDLERLVDALQDVRPAA